MTSSKDKELKPFFEAFEDQQIFAKAVMSGKYKNLIFAGDIRSGKTIICLVMLIILCKVFAGSRWAVVRESRPKLIKTTLPTFFKYCCPPAYIKDFHKSELTFTGKNNSQILFLSESFDQDPELTDFWGLEVNGFLLNQGDELQKEMYHMTVMRRGQWRLDKMPPAITLIDTNPTNNWIRPKFYDPFINNTLANDTYFQLADMDKNPYITEEYKRDLKKVLPPEIYARYCQNNWDVIDAILQLTPWEDIRACKDKVECASQEKFMGVDVGHDGVDPSVWTILKGDNIDKIIEIGKTKIPEVTRKTKQLILEERIDPDNVCIDGVGLGAGVIDELEEEDYNVIKMMGGTPCTHELTGTNFTFANHRSWSNWLASQQLKDRKMGNFTNQKLVSDAGAIKYEIRGDKSIYIMSKVEIKKKLKRSPDNWDSYCYGVWAKKQDEINPPPGVFTI